MEMRYLTNEHLAGFENYKYSALDTSPLSIYVMHPFWNKVVLWCPKWIAPNVLTFVGFLFTVFNFILFSYYDYYFYASSLDHSEIPPIPRWVWLAAAINIFLAYTLDGVDGKQARRTQTSGPLGELFDHGLDSWTAVLIPTCMYSIFGRTTQGISAMRFYFCLWNVFINFHLSHWEKYNTGVLFLPWGYDASMLVAIIIFLMTSICGHKFWTFRLPGDLSAGQMFELTFYICALASNLPMCIWNCRLIVSQMSSTRCEIVNWLLVPMAVTVVLSISLPSTAPYLELALLYILTTLATIAHIHYGTCVVRQMCKHFRIDCFRIRNHGD
ncbi:Uncharacterized protein GBIM_09913 [Gryllus bimaculatus]|nr:Uncharacterized protein GBIM_09913 [Gryllus bimaculatus]